MTNRALKEMGVTRISVVIKFTFFTIKNTLKKKKDFASFSLAETVKLQKLLSNFKDAIVFAVCTVQIHLFLRL